MAVGAKSILKKLEIKSRNQKRERESEHKNRNLCEIKRRGNKLKISV